MGLAQRRTERQLSTTWGTRPMAVATPLRSAAGTSFVKRASPSRSEYSRITENSEQDRLVEDIYLASDK
jgi:hypothetical protein